MHTLYCNYLTLHFIAFFNTTLYCNLLTLHCIAIFLNTTFYCNCLTLHFNAIVLTLYLIECVVMIDSILFQLLYYIALQKKYGIVLQCLMGHLIAMQYLPLTNMRPIAPPTSTLTST